MLLFHLFYLTHKCCKMWKTKLLCAVALDLHVHNFIVNGEGRVKSPLTLHDTHFYLAVTICPVCVAFCKSEMKRTLRDLVLMVLHHKVAFHSDISSSFQVVIQNMPHSKVHGILPLIQTFFFMSSD